jgi:CDP-4-dehydro-6-deoxyglucose reductase
MPQLLSIFRAARLVGVSRGTLQKRVHDDELPTFEGMIKATDLLRLYPGTELGHDTEYERVQHIKAAAYSKRVRERMLPSAEALLARVNLLAEELAAGRLRLAHFEDVMSRLLDRLTDMAGSSPGSNTFRDMAAWLQTELSKSIPGDEPARQLLAHDTVLRVMSAHVTLKPSGHEYWLDGTDSLLEAGLRAGLALNYGCTNGNCGLCKARVMSGQVTKIMNHDYVLSEAEKGRNYVLMCANTAATDVVIEALEAGSEFDIPMQSLVAKVKDVDFPTPDVLLLHLQTPRVQRLRFLAGQSLTLTLADGQYIDLTIASCPCDDRNLLFHIRHRLDNPIDAKFFLLGKGDEVRLTGPHGDFLLDEDSLRTQIFLAHDMGFAPIKSLIEHSLSLDRGEAMHLYWAVDDASGLYANNLCRAWHDALENFHYHPVVGASPVEQIIADHPRLQDCDVYLAGPQQKVERDAAQLRKAGLPDTQLRMEIVD